MIIIADDITGAAEIAGLAFTKGLQVQLVCSSAADNSSAATFPVCCDSVAAQGITVIATDTRSMTEAEAITETHRIASPLLGRERGRLFKKTDSALRGHVVAELTALIQATGYQRAVYVPANPSKGRIIRGGIYYIRKRNHEGEGWKDIPIHQTEFSYDPEFPALTSNLHERFPDAESHHIIMPNAETEADIRRIVTQYDDGATLFAGAADLFEALLTLPRPLPKGRGVDSSCADYQGIKGSYSPPYREGQGEGQCLFLCGSTQSKPLSPNIPVSPMPLAIYDRATDLSLWNVEAYFTHHRLALTIPHSPFKSETRLPVASRTGKESAVHLRTMMAQMARQLVTAHCPDHLVIEGGATAWSTLHVLGWHNFTIVNQLAPGVVQMRADCGTVVTLKPGSYPWPSKLLNF